jgi:hypothetical protein
VKRQRRVRCRWRPALHVARMSVVGPARPGRSGERRTGAGPTKAPARERRDRIGNVARGCRQSKSSSRPRSRVTRASEDFAFPSRMHESPHLGMRKYARILVTGSGLGYSLAERGLRDRRSARLVSPSSQGDAIERQLPGATSSSHSLGRPREFAAAPVPLSAREFAASIARALHI